MSGPELRIDPLTGRRVIVAESRGQRPGGGLEVPPPVQIESADDPFAEGHEAQTPPELYAIRPNASAADTPGWSVRVVPNSYPALLGADAFSSALPSAAPPAGRPADPPITARADREADLFYRAPALGAHELIINSPRQVVSLGQLELAELQTAIDVWRERLAPPRRRRLPAPDRQRAGGGRVVDPPHARTAVRARVRSRGHRTGAGAFRRVRNADDGRATCSAT